MTTTTTRSSGVTVKQASETDLLTAGEEKFDSNWSMNKHKVDEGDDRNIETESETESEDDGVFEGEVGDGRVPYGKYIGLDDTVEPEPEWDVDSFDGREYESDPEIRGSFANENAYLEYREYRIQALKNPGFLPDPFNFIGAIQDLDEPAFSNMTYREYLADLASLCVKKLNDYKGNTVEFVSIVRATTNGGGPRWNLYITFMAREYPNGPLVEYQAKAMNFAGQSRPPFPILCRPAPKPLTN
ncbi:hypothetical protein CARUB_v10001832mg [Capsella rubella]|uniref:Cystatin domain-containing protein n=1 Tax=Capsella rubella TaxID=81985 RepID=R0GX30_9BRAS|nr:uncharacterized protein LOC17884308 [Capsella rubella]EOA21449.1 hypothetical protein CARUB_v10001832mg [Capsella rubella]